MGPLNCLSSIPCILVYAFLDLLLFFLHKVLFLISKSKFSFGTLNHKISIHLNWSKSNSVDLVFFTIFYICIFFPTIIFLGSFLIVLGLWFHINNKIKVANLFFTLLLKIQFH